MAKTTAQSLGERIAAHQQRGKDLEIEREQILAESTEARLEANRVATQAWINEYGELNRERSQALSAAGIPARRVELEAAIKKLWDDERLAVGDAMNTSFRGLPERYIRVDSVEHFTREAAEYRRKASELLRKHTTRHSTPGGRIVAQAEELRGFADDLDKAKQLQQLGQRVARYREERAQLDAELAEFNAKHCEEVLAG